MWKDLDQRHKLKLCRMKKSRDLLHKHDNQSLQYCVGY